jgi:DNA-binding MarR family transcriptional regulator
VQIRCDELKPMTMIPTGLDDNIIYQTGRFAKNFNDLLTRSFKDAGYNITGEQFSILTVLWYADGVSQQHIASAIERDKTTISRVLDSMIKRNLLVRKPAIEDKREKLIFLTEEGKQLQSVLVQISGAMYLRAINGLSELEIRSILKLLHAMNQNLK